MKKAILAAASAVLLAGCTTVQSTQKFNALSLGTDTDKAVCQSFVEIPGLFFCGLPIVVGGIKGDGSWSAFRQNLTADHAIFALTKEAKSKGATRLINVQINTTTDHIILPIFTWETIQASGTGVRNRDAAIRQAAESFDNEP